MKLFGLMVAQDESDIIEDVLDFLSKLNIYEATFLGKSQTGEDLFSHWR